MLAGRPQAGIKRALGRPAVGSGRAAGFELNEGSGLLRPGRDDAARAVVLEAARDQPDAIGEQGRRERIPGMALIGAPVKPEVEDPEAVDRAADREAEGLGHGLGQAPVRLATPRRGGGPPLFYTI